ncbi:hypothetical protein P1X14_10190 [Sphingomonas sp. AOB5]|uniref:hypothetical protein n=1 Tax=Sphingomonas sp. AOB5 TaxID=3034017 RepID=UPI0023F7FA22|nr:hypothetical protein [Sphingomonas sp. AOB5]MDF7775616.1 hypothetical protein [Sphingomonas sp. AOB5]
MNHHAATSDRSPAWSADRPRSSTTIDAVIHAYQQLIGHGVGEAWALEAARRVFGYHEPHLSIQTARAIVGEIVARGVRPA